MAPLVKSPHLSHPWELEKAYESLGTASDREAALFLGGDDAGDKASTGDRTGGARGSGWSVFLMKLGKRSKM